MIVYTGGTFDGLHPGHLELLTACRALAGPAGRVIVSLNTDEFVAAYKGHTPALPFAHRREMLLACRLVDAVVRNVGGSDSTLAIEVVHPDVIAIGDDWLDPGHDERRYHAQLGVTPAWLAARNLTIAYVPRTRGVSTTAIRDLFEQQGIEPPRPGWRVEGGRVVRG